MNDIITVKDLRLWYGQTQALKGVSMDIPEKSITALIGPSGCGKSTFLKTLDRMNDLVPGVRIEGEVQYNGQNIFAPQVDVNELRRQIGMVFQKPNPFPMSIYDNIAYGPRNMGLDEEEITRRVKRAAEFVGLDEALLQKSPFELSGGQKRRVAIASILAMEPKVLILDEPCAGLDPRGRDQILDLIRSYRDRTGATVLFVSHSMEDVARICRRVLVMHRGQVAAYGPVADVYANAEELRQMGLNVPQVTDIFLELRRRGVPCRTDIFTVDDGVREFQRLKREGVRL